jgi:uncharacterized protein
MALSGTDEPLRAPGAVHDRPATCVHGTFNRSGMPLGHQTLAVVVRSLFLVYQEHGGPWDWSKGLREQALFAEHAQFVDGLVAKGAVVLGGPLDEKDVLLVVDAASADTVRELFANDPWIERRMLRITAIRPWSVLLDGTRQGAVVAEK